MKLEFYVQYNFTGVLQFSGYLKKVERTHQNCFVVRTFFVFKKPVRFNLDVKLGLVTVGKIWTGNKFGPQHYPIYSYVHQI